MGFILTMPQFQNPIIFLLSDLKCEIFSASSRGRQKTASDVQAPAPAEIAFHLTRFWLKFKATLHLTVANLLTGTRATLPTGCRTSNQKLDCRPRPWFDIAYRLTSIELFDLGFGIADFGLLQMPPRSVLNPLFSAWTKSRILGRLGWAPSEMLGFVPQPNLL